MKNKGVIYFILTIIIVNGLFYSCKSHKIMIEDTSPIDFPEEMKADSSEEASNEMVTNFLSEYLKLKYKDMTFNKYMYVSIKHQRLYLIENDSTIKKYPISTSFYGIGSKQDSYQTPPGLHIIKRKIGGNVPYGGIFESREFNGEIAKILTKKENAPKDYVTSRIMWLEGKEPGINKGRRVDSYNRFIYIHGTPEEGLIGQPASHGCIRMKNKDVIELYNIVDEGTPILILKY